MRNKTFLQMEEWHRAAQTREYRKRNGKNSLLKFMLCQEVAYATTTKKTWHLYSGTEQIFIVKALHYCTCVCNTIVMRVGSYEDQSKYVPSFPSSKSAGPFKYISIKIHINQGNLLKTYRTHYF